MYYAGHVKDGQHDKISCASTAMLHTCPDAVSCGDIVVCAATVRSVCQLCFFFNKNYTSPPPCFCQFLNLAPSAVANSTTPSPARSGTGSKGCNHVNKRGQSHTARGLSSELWDHAQLQVRHRSVANCALELVLSCEIQCACVLAARSQCALL